MADEQEQLQEGWEARDVRSGVAKVYHEAKRRNVLGVRIAAGWAVAMILFAALDVAGVATVANPYWEFAAALLGMLLAALGMSRTPAPLLLAAMVVFIDLIVVAFRLPELFDRGEGIDFVATGIRVTLAPVALSMILNGYFGALSIQAFKLGFSPGADWRTRINPAMLQITVVGSCIAALAIGVGSWFGAIRSGFMQPGALWEPRDPMLVAGEAAKDESGVMPFTSREELPEPEPKYPEGAVPIESTAGMDAFMQRAVEEAHEWGVDSDQAECVAEGQGRQDRCRDDRCRYWARVFVRACLTKAKRAPRYCEEVPPPKEVSPGKLWAQRLCAGREFEMCRELLYAVQGHCHPPTEAELEEAGIGLTFGVGRGGGSGKEPPNVLKDSAERAAKAMNERR